MRKIDPRHTASVTVTFAKGSSDPLEVIHNELAKLPQDGTRQAVAEMIKQMAPALAAHVDKAYRTAGNAYTWDLDRP
jgi:hypothetical protein